MHLNNRRRIMTEGALVSVEEEVKENLDDTVEVIERKRVSQHRRVHSVPATFDDFFIETNELRDSLLSYNEGSSKEEVHRSLEEEFDIINYMKYEMWNDVEMCCQEFPEIVRKEVQVVIYGEKIRCLPLHYACRMNPPISTIEALITAFPEALVMEDSLNRSLPIHFACRFDTSSGVIQTMLESCPEVAQRPDQNGNLPLHLACCYSTYEASKILLQTFPEASFVANSKNKLPVHLLCSQSDVNISFLTWFIGIHREVLSIADGQGALPIHLAITHRAPLFLVQFLLSSLPQSVFARNIAGKTPLDLVKFLCRSQDLHPILQAVQDAHDTNGTPMCRAVNSIQSQYNAAVTKRAKQNSSNMEMIRLKFVTTYPRNLDQTNLSLKM